MYIHMYMCVYIYIYIYIYIYNVCVCARARACLMSTRTPFHLPLLLHPNLEFFIPQLPSAKCVLYYILCKFLPVRPSALPSFRPSPFHCNAGSNVV